MNLVNSSNTQVMPRQWSLIEAGAGKCCRVRKVGRIHLVYIPTSGWIDQRLDTARRLEELEINLDDERASTNNDLIYQYFGRHSECELRCG